MGRAAQRDVRWTDRSRLTSPAHLVRAVLDEARPALCHSSQPDSEARGLLADLGTWTIQQVAGKQGAVAGTANRILVGLARLSLIQATELGIRKDMRAPIGWLMRGLSCPAVDAGMLRDAAKAEQALAGAAQGSQGVDAEAWIRVAEAGLGRWTMPAEVEGWARETASLHDLHQVLARGLRLTTTGNGHADQRRPAPIAATRMRKGHQVEEHQVEECQGSSTVQGK